MSDIVSVEVSWIRAQEAIVSALWIHFNATKDAAFSVVTTGGKKFSGADPQGDYVAGVPLPDLDVVYRQTSPNLQQIKTVGGVAAFVGPTGDEIPDGRDRYLGGAFSEVYDARLPFGATIIYSVAPASIADPVTGRELTMEEVMQCRGLMYLGALKRCIAERVAGTPAAKAIVPRDDLSIAGDIVVSPRIGASGEPDAVYTGTSVHSFEVLQRVGIPRSS